MIFGTLAERGRVCGKPTCRCARGEQHPAVQLAHWAGDGKTRSQHVPYAVADTVRAGVDAWHRFQAIARELAARHRTEVMLVLKHLYRWSYAELEQEVRAKSIGPLPGSAATPCRMRRPFSRSRRRWGRR